MPDIPEPYVGPCGCRFDCVVIDGVNTLVVTACPKGLDCEWAQWVMKEGMEKGIDPTVIG